MSVVCRHRYGFLIAVGVTGLLLAILAGSAQAVIDPGMPLPRLYRVAGYVNLAEVSAVDEKAQTATLKYGPTLRGTATMAQVVVDLSLAEGLAKGLKVGQPAVIFGARIKGCSMHMGDALLDCPDRPAGDPPTWQVSQRHKSWMAFPGTTEQLVAELKKLAAEADTIGATASRPGAPVAAAGAQAPLQPAEPPRNLPKYGGYTHFYFPRYVEVMQLKARPLFMQCADVNADKLPDLLVGYADGVQLLQCTSGGFTKLAFQDITADVGLSAAKGAVASFELYRTDGKPSLLIGRTLYANVGGKFIPSPVATQLPNAAEVLACGLAAIGGAGASDALYVTRSGALYVNNSDPVQLWTEKPDDASVGAFFHKWGPDDKTYLMVLRNSGPVRYSLDGTSADDIARLSGTEWKQPLQVVTATPISIDGTDRGGAPGNSAGIDLYIVSDALPDLAMYNRTQGFFIASGKMGCWRNGPGLVTRELIAKAKGGTWSQQAFLKGRIKVAPIAMAAGDFARNDRWEELLFATAENKLYVADNIPWPWHDDTEEIVGP